MYYLNRGNHLDAFNQPTGEPFWASPDNVARLNADEYFVLGDNSEVSLDARYWGTPVHLPREGNYKVAAGRVPGRFMLGKAFFVYWPAGFARPPSPTALNRTSATCGSSTSRENAGITTEARRARRGCWIYLGCN